MLQKLLFKLFKWRISIKVEKLSEEEKAKFFLNELVIAVQKSGKSFANPTIQDGFGSANIYMHHMGTADANLVIEKIGEWRIQTKPAFKLKEE